MKKTILAAAAFAALSAVALPSMAEVSIYGVADVGVRNVSTGGVSTTTVSNGANMASRLGFKGTEDLGGGLKASFALEGGFNMDSGASAKAGVQFDRRSTLSLNGEFGEVRLGRDLTPTYLAVGSFDPFVDAGVGALTTMVDAPGAGAAVQVRANNMAQYISPTFSGLTGTVGYSTDEAAAPSKYLGARLVYSNGPLSAQVGYGVAGAGISADGDFSQASVGASYDLGMVKLMGVAVAASNDVDKTTTYQLGLQAPVGKGQVRASYARSDVNVVDKDSSRFAVGYVHSMSTRTALYTTASYLSNDSAAKRGGAAADGANVRNLEVGLRHSF